MSGQQNPVGLLSLQFSFFATSITQIFPRLHGLMLNCNEHEDSSIGMLALSKHQNICYHSLPKGHTFVILVRSTGDFKGKLKCYRYYLSFNLFRRICQKYSSVDIRCRHLSMCSL